MHLLKLSAVLVVLLSACVTQNPNIGAALASSIRPKYTQERWLALVNEKYKCSNPVLTSIAPNNTKVAGVISEKWQANVCGQERTFFPILTPDGQGGYLVAFGE